MVPLYHSKGPGEGDRSFIYLYAQDSSKYILALIQFTLKYSDSISSNYVNLGFSLSHRVTMVTVPLYRSKGRHYNSELTVLCLL
jgi:hypothetical protein